MRVINFAVAAAVMLVFPVLLCSCNSSPAKKENKQEVQPPKTAVAADPKPVEITSESSFVAETPAQAESAAAPVKAEAAKAEPAAAPVKAEAAKAPVKVEILCEHTVRTGDNLWKISCRYYGTGKYWKKIYEANKSEIRKPEFLEPGTVLKIPAK